MTATATARYRDGDSELAGIRVSNTVLRRCWRLAAVAVGWLAGGLAAARRAGGRWLPLAGGCSWRLHAGAHFTAPADGL